VIIVEVPCPKMAITSRTAKGRADTAHNVIEADTDYGIMRHEQAINMMAVPQVLDIIITPHSTESILL
jgi:hypothetical protein